MDSTIKTENGIFTINYVPKHYKIEEYDERFDIINVEYSSNTFVLGQEAKIENLFKEYEPQIIQIIQFKIAENPEFYRHFDIDFALIGKSLNYTRIGDFTSNYYQISWSRFLSSELKSDSLEYLKSLTDEQKRFAFGY